MEFVIVADRKKYWLYKHVFKLIDDHKLKLTQINQENLSELLEKKSFYGIKLDNSYPISEINNLDSLDNSSKLTGRIDTIINENGHAVGYDANYMGFCDLLKDNNLEFSNKNIVIVGKGYKSEIVFNYLKNANAKRIQKISFKELTNLSSNQVSVMINTQRFNNEHYCLDEFKNLEAVIDVNINPLKTSLISLAKEKNTMTIDGTMLQIYQIIQVHQLFSQNQLSKEAKQNIYHKVFSERENIVLTGMPTSGKTTISRLLHKETGRNVIDCDYYLEKKYHQKISAIFANEGEAVFRKYESEVIGELMFKQGVIISTGGGVILKKENIDNLKLNGRIYYIDRPLEKLFPTSYRPLSNDLDSLQKRYYERHDLYISTSDEIIENNKEIEEAVKEIERILLNESNHR